MEANSGRKVVKKWVTAKIKEIADHGVAGWVIKREHPVIQTSQDAGATDENNAAAGVPPTLNQAAPARDLPPEHPGGASSPSKVNGDSQGFIGLKCDSWQSCKDSAAAQVQVVHRLTHMSPVQE